VHDGLHQPVGRDELDEGVLDDVLDLGEIGDLTAHECTQPRFLGGNGRSNPIIGLAGVGGAQARRSYGDRRSSKEFIEMAWRTGQEGLGGVFSP